MFETRKELQSQLEASQAEVSRLEAELTAANAKVEESATLTQQVSELTEDLEACKAGLTTEAEAHAATKELLAAEQAKTTPEAINKIVTAQLATAGHPPIDDVPSGNQEAEKKLTREAFNKLTPRQRSEFSIHGGTITD